MGISTNSRVAFICAQDESKWAQPFIDEMKIPTKGRVGGFKTIDVPGAGFWADDLFGVPIYGCDVRLGGRVIVLDTGYYGLMDPARMNLPASLQAVVYSSDSCQQDPQDPIFAVLAENIRSHDFSDTNEVVKQYWFDYEGRRNRLYNVIEAAAWDDEKEEERFDTEPSMETVEKLLINKRVEVFETLVAKLAETANLSTPFLDGISESDIKAYLKRFKQDEVDEEYWEEGYDVDSIPTWEFTNTAVIGERTDDIDVVGGLPSEIQEMVKEALQIAEDAEAKRLEWMTQFAPSKEGMTRAEYAAAFEAAIAGGEDATGAFKAIQALHLPENADRNLKGYTLARIKSETSPVGNKLIAATKGEDVHQLIQGLFQSGKYNSFGSEPEPEPPAEPEWSNWGIIEEEEYKEDERYNLLVLISNDDYIDTILGDEAAEKNWVPAFNRATDEDLWRFTAGKALVTEDGERLSKKELAKEFGIDLDIIDPIELCFSPKWADGFDYTPLWEAALSDESIGEETTVDKLAALIKADKYFMGDHGGYLADDTTRTAYAELDEEDNEDECGWDLSGKRVCITGKLTSPRDEVEGWLSDVGATVVSSVSKTTDALIVGEKAGSKLDKAKELGTKILTEEEAHALLGEISDGITEAWAKRIIERLLSDLPDTDMPGYFKTTDAVGSKVVYAANKEELCFWLEECIGLESTSQRYIEFSDVENLKVTWVELNQEDYVTVFYYDNECGSIDSLTEVSFNNHQDALSFAKEKNSGWGGHLSALKVCEQKGDTFKMIVGDEVMKLDYPYWDSDLDMVLDDLDCYPEVAELLSDNPEHHRKELHEIIRKGLWPKPKAKIEDED